MKHLKHSSENNRGFPRKSDSNPVKTERKTQSFKRFFEYEDSRGIPCEFL